MQKELSYKRIREWIKKNKVIDVALFGSSMRGKANPRDIDLCILISDKAEDNSLDLVQSLKAILKEHNTHVSILTSSSFLKGEPLAKTVLNEGYSIIQSKPFSENFNLKSKTMFLYTLKAFNASKRVRFHYLLNGRYGSRGLLKEFDAKLLGPGSIIVPTEKEDAFKSVLDYWTVDYRIDRILIS